VVTEAQLAVLLSLHDELSAPLKQAQGEMTNTGTKLSSLQGIAQTALVGGAAYAMASFGKSAITAASDTNESMSKVKVVFGDSANQIKDFAATSATSLGLSRQAALEATGTFGNLFTAMGLGQQKSVDMSKGIVQLAADLASFNNIRPEDALEKLRAGLVGEVEPLRTVGVNLNAMDIAQRAVQMGLATTTDNISAAAKAQAAYAIILDQTKSAQGDFARTSSGMANQTRILNAEVKDLEANVGKLALPAATFGVKELNHSIQGWGIAFDGVSTGAGNLLGHISNLGSEAPHIFASLTKGTIDLSSAFEAGGSSIDDYHRRLKALGQTEAEDTATVFQYAGAVDALSQHLSGLGAALTQSSIDWSQNVAEQVKSIQSTSDHAKATEAAYSALANSNKESDRAIAATHFQEEADRAAATAKSAATAAASAYAETLPGMIDELYKNADADRMRKQALAAYNSEMGIATDLEGNAIPAMRDLVNAQLDSIDASKREAEATRMANAERGIQLDINGNVIKSFQQMVEEQKASILSSQQMQKATDEANKELKDSGQLIDSTASSLDSLTSSLGNATAGWHQMTDAESQAAAKTNATNSANAPPMKANVGSGPTSGGSVAFFSHATGLSSVPYDNYPALLHAGEGVVTAAANLNGGGGGGITIHINGDVYGMDDFKAKVNQAILQTALGGGYRGVFSPFSN
jgi:hypothetical protein